MISQTHKHTNGMFSRKTTEVCVCVCVCVWGGGRWGGEGGGEGAVGGGGLKSVLLMRNLTLNPYAPLNCSYTLSLHRGPLPK